MERELDTQEGDVVALRADREQPLPEHGLPEREEPHERLRAEDAVGRDAEPLLQDRVAALVRPSGTPVTGPR